MARTPVDLRGLKYTMPLVKLSAALRNGHPGELFEALCDYPPFEQDIKRWCESTGNLLRSLEKSGSEISAVIEKKS